MHAVRLIRFLGLKWPLTFNLWHGLKNLDSAYYTIVFFYPILFLLTIASYTFLALFSTFLSLLNLSLRYFKWQCVPRFSLLQSDMIIHMCTCNLLWNNFKYPVHRSTVCFDFHSNRKHMKRGVVGVVPLSFVDTRC